MQARSLHLVITDLLGRSESVQPVTLTATETALARARSRKVAGVRESIGRAFNLSEQSAQRLPYASITRLADTGSWQPRGWLRADPVHLYADATRLVLFDPAMLEVSPAEARELVASFAVLYAAEGYQLEAPVAQRWYIRLPEVSTFQTTPLPSAIGSDLNATMPQGADAQKLRALLTEVQMLFHEHPVNQARVKAARASISGIWLWGEGWHAPRLPDPPATVYANDPYSRGLARLAATRVAEPPRDARAWLASAPAGADLIVLDREAGWPQTDAGAWPRLAQRLEADWFAPLVAALKTGQLQQLFIYPGDGRSYRLTRGRLWHFWRRRRSLSDYVH